MTAKVNQHIPIFICSTEKDLKEHRSKVWERMEKLELGVSGMEIFGARTNAPLETCLKEVSDCNYLIGIVGMRYGSIDADSGKSFVQLEYEMALEKKLDILIYLIDEDNARVSPKNVDRGESASKLESFKETLQRRHTTSPFISPDDLADKIERDLTRLFKEKGLTFDEDKIEPVSDEDNTIDMLRKFNLIPLSLRGKEVELIIKFDGDPKKVSYKRCETLRLLHGSSLVRNIRIVRPSQNEENYDFLDRLYSEGDLSNFLIDSPNDSDYKILARLSFGMERSIVTTPDSPNIFGTYVSFIDRSSPTKPMILKDYDTGESIDVNNYLTRKEVRAIILREIIN